MAYQGTLITICNSIAEKVMVCLLTNTSLYTSKLPTRVDYFPYFQTIVLAALINLRANHCNHLRDLTISSPTLSLKDHSHLNSNPSGLELNRENPGVLNL